MPQRRQGGLVLYLCVTNYPQTWHLTGTHLYYLAICVGWGSEHSLAGPSSSDCVTRPVERQPGLWASQGPTGP